MVTNAVVVRTVACPACGAQAGEQCRTRTQGTTLQPHVSRIDHYWQQRQQAPHVNSKEKQ